VNENSNNKMKNNNNNNGNEIKAKEEKEKEDFKKNKYHQKYGIMLDKQQKQSLDKKLEELGALSDEVVFIADMSDHDDDDNYNYEIEKKKQ